GEGDGGWYGAPVRHAFLVEGPGGPEPEREDDDGGRGGTADVTSGHCSDADVTEAMDSEAQQRVLVKGRATLCSVTADGGRGDNEPHRGDGGCDISVGET